MNYEKTVPFQGDFNKAAETIRNTLLLVCLYIPLLDYGDSSLFNSC